MKHFLKIFISALTLISLSTFTSCRVGNYVEKQEVIDNLKGYYGMTPRQMLLKIIVNGQTREKEVSTEEIPDELSRYISDPVGLLQAKSQSNLFYLINKDDPYAGGLPVFIHDDWKTMKYLGVGSPEILWKSFNRCTQQLTINEEGELFRNPNRISMNFEITRAIDGTQCAEALTDIKNCYNDVNQCDSVASSAKIYQQQAINFFGQYLDSGIITLDELPYIQNIGYQAAYQ